MIKRIVVFWLLLGSAFFCLHQQPGSRAAGWLPLATAPAAPSFTGPGDVATYHNYWSVGPCYSAAYASAGSQAFILKRASDSTTQAINCLSTGLPDYTTATTFCLATTCTIRLIKDQAGGGSDLSDANGQTLPTYTAASLGTCAGMSSPSGTVYLVGPSFTQAQPFTLQAISDPVDNGADSILGEITGGGVATVQVRYWFGPTPPLTLFATSNANTGPTSTTGSYSDVMGYFNGASSAARVNAAAEVTLSPGATGLSNANNFRIFAVDSPGSIKIVQAGIMVGTQTSGSRATLNTNLHTQCGSW